jgi:hypothetical protein
MILSTGAFRTTARWDRQSLTNVDFGGLSLQGLPSGDPQKLFAVGKYLLIPVTLRAPSRR